MNPKSLTPHETAVKTILSLGLGDLDDQASVVGHYKQPAKLSPNYLIGKIEALLAKCYRPRSTT